MRRSSARLWLAVLALPLLAGAWQDFTLHLPYHRADFGNILQASVRLLDGQVPYRDYFLIWPPFGPMLLAGAFSVLGGPSLWAAKVPLALNACLTIVLVYRWLRWNLPRRAALAGAAAVWLLAPIYLRLPYTMAFTVAPALLAFIQLGRLQPGRLMGPAWWAGVACGISLGFKHNVGILVGLGIWTSLLCVTPYASLAPRPSAQPRFAGIVRVCCTCAALLALAYLCIRVTASASARAAMLAPAGALTLAAAYLAWRRDIDSTQGIAWRRLAGATGLAGAGVAAVTLPWTVWLWTEGALAPFLQAGLFVTSGNEQNWGAIYGTLMALWPADCSTVLLGVAIACAAGAVRAERKRVRWTCAGAALTCAATAWGLAPQLVTGLRGFAYAPLVLFGVLIFVAGQHRHGGRVFRAAGCAAWFAPLAYPAATVDHLAFALTPTVGLCVGLAWRATKQRGHIGRVAVLALLATAVVYGWGEWAAATLTLSPDGVRRQPLARVPGPRGGTWTQSDLAVSLDRTARLLDAHSPAGAPVVAWPSLGIVNFYADRPNPTSLDYYWPGYMDNTMERKLLAEIQAARPPLVIISTANDLIFGNSLFWKDAPMLGAYIDAHYLPLRQYPAWAVLARKETGSPTHLRGSVVRRRSHGPEDSAHQHRVPYTGLRP